MKSITKKSVAGLLAIALLLGTIFATIPFFNVQAEGEIEVNSVHITVQPPIAGETVSYGTRPMEGSSYPIMTVSIVPTLTCDNPGVTLGGYFYYLPPESWNPVQDFTFYEGVDYGVHVYITKRDGYKLSDDFFDNVYINGQKMTYSDEYGVNNTVTTDDFSRFRGAGDAFFIIKAVASGTTDEPQSKEETERVIVDFPYIANRSEILNRTEVLDIPKSIVESSSITRYLYELRKMNSFSEYTAIDPSIRAFSTRKTTDQGMTKFIITLERNIPTYDNLISVDSQAGTAVVYDKVAKEQRTINYEQVVNGYIYRMYDASRGEHFYTKNVTEKDALIAAGWTHESESDFNVVGAEETDAIPVYRLYNPHDGGMHFYTENADEATYLDSIGWDYEGISHYVYSKDSSMGMPQYRLSNPNSTNGEHNWTTNVEEYSMLKAAGWIDEGICWKVVG